MDGKNGLVLTVVEFLTEQNEVMEAKKGSDGKLTWNEIQMMKYTWRVAQEMMRFTPPILGNFRQVTRDIHFDGFDIPKGWQVLMQSVILCFFSLQYKLSVILITL